MEGSEWPGTRSAVITSCRQFCPTSPDLRSALRNAKTDQPGNKNSVEMFFPILGRRDLDFDFEDGGEWGIGIGTGIGDPIIAPP